MVHGCDGTAEVCSRVCPVQKQTQEPCSYCKGIGFYDDVKEKDDWAYDEAKDNELQDKLSAQNELPDNPVY